MIEWVEEQDNAITNEALEQQFGPLGAQPVDDVLEKSERIHVALLALTGSERFAPSGPEALRRWVRRWDPLSGGTILVPDRCKLQDLSARLQKWEELVRRYDRSKSSGTRTAALDEDIKTAALEAFFPSELEQHLDMNRARPMTSKQDRSYIQAYNEARRSQFAFKTVAAKSTSDPMYVDISGKEGKEGEKGKGDGKKGKKGGKGQNQNQNQNPSKDVVCWHGGEKGHLSTEYWSNPKNQSGSGGGQKEGGKGKLKNGAGSGAGPLEHGDQAAAVEPQPKPALASALYLASFETPGRSPHLDPEQELCSMHAQQLSGGLRHPRRG